MEVSNRDSLLCLFGGILIGCIVAARMFIFGKVTGISGMLSSVIIFDDMNYMNFERILKLLFLMGLVTGGIVLNKKLPESFDSWSNIPIGRIISGGFLVGLGTLMANGCTSGHGICGIASFRIRSIIATMLFMSSGILTAILFDTRSFFPPFVNILDIDVAQRMTLIGICCSVAASLFAYIYRPILLASKPYVQLLSFMYEFMFGVLFSTALVISNMTRMSATISFLDVRSFNPALSFVMMGAISISVVAFYFAYQMKGPFWDEIFHRSPVNAVDLKLVLGAVLFGIGWGLVGACPAGMWFQQYFESLINQYLTKIVLYDVKSKEFGSIIA